MTNEQIAARLTKLAKVIISKDGKEAAVGDVSRDVDTLYGKTAIGLTDLWTAIQRDKDIPRGWKNTMINKLQDVIDEHNGLGAIIEDYRSDE